MRAISTNFRCYFNSFSFHSFGSSSLRTYSPGIVNINKLWRYNEWLSWVVDEERGDDDTTGDEKVEKAKMMKKENMKKHKKLKK